MPNLFLLEDGSYAITDDLVSKRQLMSIIGICRQTLQNWQRKGMPYTHFKNNRNAYNSAEVDRWLIDQDYPSINDRAKMRRGTEDRK